MYFVPLVYKFILFSNCIIIACLFKNTYVYLVLELFSDENIVCYFSTSKLGKVDAKQILNLKHIDNIV